MIKHDSDPKILPKESTAAVSVYWQCVCVCVCRFCSAWTCCWRDIS